VDDVFADDTDMRWPGYYLKPDVSGQYPRCRCRKVERPQLIDLYFLIKHLHIAKHFQRGNEKGSQWLPFVKGSFQLINQP
jgi:hypothetical protein